MTLAALSSWITISPLFFDFVAKHFAAQRPRDEKQSLGRGKGGGDKGKRTKTKEREKERGG